MCVNYTPTRKDQIAAKFDAIDQTGENWKGEVWQDYAAPFIVHGEPGQRLALLGNYGMIPKAKLPPGVKRFSTMNARAETLDKLRSYAKPWREGQLCLVPMQNFFEPNYESGHAERWQIGVKDISDFAVAGLFREWGEENAQRSFSFTQITVNADEHPLLNRFHKPGDEKRSLVIIAPQDYDAWLNCRDTEQARGFLRLYPAENLSATVAPKLPPRPKKTAPLPSTSAQMSLL